MSAAKHYTAFDSSPNVDVDPQTLREIYVAPFAAAVDAGIASVLCSSNTINGPYSCGSGATLNGILKGELGFKGFVIPDFEGTHSTLYINEGLDLEMPGGVEGQSTGRGGFFLANPPPVAGANPAAGRGRGAAAAAPANPAVGSGTPLAGMPEERAVAGAAGTGGARGGARGGAVEAPMGMLVAIERGLVKESTITAAVGRILNQMDRFGYLDNGSKHNITPIDHAVNTPILRKTAEDAAVLLKNVGNALPLTASDLASVAMIGPAAGQTISVGITGGKGNGIPANQTGAVAEIEKATGKKVIFAPVNDMTGTPIPAAALAPGLARITARGNLTQLDPQLDFTTKSGGALPPGSSSTWTGTLTVPTDGSYMIALQALGTAATLAIDGQAVARTGAPGPGRGGAILHPNQDSVLPTTDGLDNVRNFVTLKAGAHQLAVTNTGEQAGHPVQLRLAWVTPEQQKSNYDAAIAAARTAKKAVVFAWGRDRPEVFKLPGDQDKLIADIAAVNPNTIVVLNTGFPVAMPWLDSVKAVVQMWWPGDQGGPAAANILLGRTNPAGRLPFTWPQALDQMVANDPTHPERSNRGVDGKTTYSEGIFIGYRWFDKQNLTPLFPFGHGLSYTTFTYSRLKVTPAKNGGLDVSFALRNTGKTAGDEVPQIYLGPPKQAPEGAQFALKALAGFDRINVPAGQTRNVTIHIAPRRLQYWSASTNKWVTAPGARTVHVAASSRDIKLSSETVVR
jgi:beta-glucosidase